MTPPDAKKSGRVQKTDVGEEVIPQDAQNGPREALQASWSNYSLNLFSKMHRILPFIPLASPNSMFQPIYVRDLVEIIYECINRDPKTKKSVFECVGPDIFSLYELVSLAGKYSGKSKMIIPLSKNLGLLQAFFMEMLPGKPLLSRDNLLSASIPNIATNDQELVYQLENFQNIHSIAPKYL